MLWGLFGSGQSAFRVDLSLDPGWMSGYKVISHERGGTFLWSPLQGALHFEPEQLAGRAISGWEIQKRLANKSPFNATMCDWFLEFPVSIPSHWRRTATGETQFIYFWNTVYADTVSTYVRCMYWSAGGWLSRLRYLGEQWDAQSPALLFVR